MADAKADNLDEAGTLSDMTIEKFAKGILNEIFYQITYDLVAEVHRDEKIARMRSAVVDVRQIAEEQALRLGEETPSKAAPRLADMDARVDPKLLAKVRVDTDAAIFRDGKAFLKGNPLKNQHEIICPECRLPRLVYPVTGTSARPPPDPNKQYCRDKPLVRKAGHDVQGNLFATDRPPLKKKKKKEKATVDTPGVSSPPGSGDEDNAGVTIYPTCKCPNCPRYFTVTRLAYHLDRCQGISGRSSTRNRTPLDSATPSSNPAKRSFVDDDSPPVASNKRKKTNGVVKTSLSKKTKPSSKLKNGITPDTAAAEDAAFVSAADDDNDSESYGDIGA